MSARSYPSSGPFSSKISPKPVSFICVAPDAGQVHLTGDFNDWDPAAHPMKRLPEGVWRVQIPLAQGDHHYRFVVDGKSILDPRAQRTTRDHQGQKVSLIAIA
jgi:1,4-alpha-glucan branching enzyme